MSTFLDLPSDVILDGILTFLPPRFILDYQLVPVWQKIMSIYNEDDSWSSNILHERSHKIIFTKQYERNKSSSLIDLLLKIVNQFERNSYGNVETFIPDKFSNFVSRLRRPDMMISKVQSEISFGEMQFVFEFVSRYNFIYLSSKFNSVMGKSSEPFEFSWVYATDPYYKTHHSLLLRRLKKSNNTSQFAYTELEESLEGCRRIRGQFFYRNGHYCCEFYNGLFLNLKREEEIELNTCWALEISDTFLYERMPVTDEYFLQRYFLPSLESKLVYKSDQPFSEAKLLGYYPHNIQTKSFKFTLIPSRKQFEMNAPNYFLNGNMLVYGAICLLLIYFQIFWPLSDWMFFSEFINGDSYCFKKFLFIISDILITQFQYLYIPRSVLMYFLGVWRIHHISMFETLIYMFFVYQFSYYVRFQINQNGIQRFILKEIPWIEKKSKDKTL